MLGGAAAAECYVASWWLQIVGESECYHETADVLGMAAGADPAAPVAAGWSCVESVSWWVVAAMLGWFVADPTVQDVAQVLL